MGTTRMAGLERKVYTEGVARTLAARLSEKGEPYEARQVASGWIVCPVSEPPEETSYVPGEHVAEPETLPEVYGGLAYMGGGQPGPYITKPGHIFGDELMEVPTHKINFPSDPPQVVLPSVGFKKIAPIYQQYQQVHGSGKQGSKGAKSKPPKKITPAMTVKKVNPAKTAPATIEGNLQEVVTMIKATLADPEYSGWLVFKTAEPTFNVTSCYGLRVEFYTPYGVIVVDKAWHFSDVWGYWFVQSAVQIIIGAAHYELQQKKLITPLFPASKG